MSWPETYIEKVAQQVYIETLPDGEENTCWPYGEESLWLGYAVLCLAKGEATTSEDVHDAWSAWAAVAHDGQHRSLIPFDELTPEVQAYDDLYRDAIHRVARKHAPYVRFTEWGGRVPKTLGDVSITVHFHRESTDPDEVSTKVAHRVASLLDDRWRLE